MKTIRSLAFLGTFILVAVLFFTWTGRTATSSPTTAKPNWEHLVLEREGNLVSADRDLAEKINRLGSDGWEMYAVTPIQQDGTTKRLQFYFKRHKS